MSLKNILQCGKEYSAITAHSHESKKITKTCRILEYGPLEWDSRPWGEGGKVFREVCKVCHTRNNDKGAPFLYAESKTPAAWNRVFAQKYPKCAQNGSWDKITLDQQLKLNDYLYRFGLNSEDFNDSC